ncbi:hypothetical protein MK805_07065 [Shimazuella sp. AN120528]|uniref:hypothetical protein n=1 Tax=Shimazuella soli TaxID=1892854 RepID=UPI001F0D6386|nr:hypothetical protein [Shimazuella soli]MCH5584730.1 hypothetical protein [Shimazuella soli]
MNENGTETLIGAKIEFFDGTVQASGTVVRKGDEIVKIDGTYETYELDESLAHLRVRAEGSIQFDEDIIVRGSCKGYYGSKDRIGWKPKHVVEILELGVEVPEHPNNITTIRNGRIRSVIGKVTTTLNCETTIWGSTKFSECGDIEEITSVGERLAYMKRYGYDCKAKSIKVDGVIWLKGNASAKSKKHTLKGEKIKVGWSQLTTKSTDPNKPAEYRSVGRDNKLYTGQNITVDLYDDVDLPPAVEVDGEYVGEW